MAAAEIQTRTKMPEENGPGEIKRTVSQECDKFKETATEYLVMRDFKNCHRVCLNGISYTKQHVDEQCARDCMESLCVLCIQALAEMNRWSAVLPLVQDTYNRLESCPYTVIQLCLLLHAKVKEYSQCYAIASIWLRCKDNIQIPEYKKVVTLYIRYVMMPQEQLVLVPQFLNSCTVLNESEKEEIISQCEKLWNEQKKNKKEEEEKECSVDDDDDDDEDSKRRILPLPEMREKDPFEDSRLVIFSRRLGAFLLRQYSYINLRTVFKVAFVSVGLYLLINKTLAGDMFTNSVRVHTIWEGTVKLLKTMFTPYRPGR